MVGTQTVAAEVMRRTFSEPHPVRLLTSAGYRVREKSGLNAADKIAEKIGEDILAGVGMAKMLAETFGERALD